MLQLVTGIMAGAVCWIGAWLTLDRGARRRPVTGRRARGRVRVPLRRRTGVRGAVARRTRGILAWARHTAGAYVVGSGRTAPRRTRPAPRPAWGATARRVSSTGAGMGPAAPAGVTGSSSTGRPDLGHRDPTRRPIRAHLVGVSRDPSGESNGRSIEPRIGPIEQVFDPPPPQDRAPNPANP